MVPQVKTEVSLPREVEESWENQKWMFTTHAILNHAEQNHPGFLSSGWGSTALYEGLAHKDAAKEQSSSRLEASGATPGPVGTYHMSQKERKVGLIYLPYISKE